MTYICCKCVRIRRLVGMRLHRICWDKIILRSQVSALRYLVQVFSTRYRFRTRTRTRTR